MKELYKYIAREDTPVWCEAKVVARPRRFSTKVLSPKARTLLQHTKLKYKFSDAMRTGTPLDFIYIPNIQPYLVVIFYKIREKNTAYFIKYDGTDYLATEGECSEMADLVISF